MKRLSNQLTFQAVMRAGRKHGRRWALASALLLLLTACSFGETEAPAAEQYTPIRSPYPTFTPTPLGAGSAPTATAIELTDPNAQPAATPTTEAAPPTDPPPAATATLSPTVAPTLAPPRLVINAPLVNVRAGPGVTYDLVSTVERGEEFDIVGKNDAGDWWRFCCIEGQPGWVTDELVETTGAIDTVAVSNDVAAAPPTATSAPAAAAPAAPAATDTPAAPTATPVPSFSFDLVGQEQFPEPQVVRVFLYVYENDRALDGYTIRVRKDGAELPVSGVSAPGQSLTWPIADARQRFQNFKAEFPGVAPAGTWEVQLVDGGGNAVGPAAVFPLEGNEPDQELYVRYKKK